MAVLATDFHGCCDLAVDVAVAMAVLRVMTIDAMHADIDMHGGEMYRLLELLRVIVGDDLTGGVEQIARAIPLEHGAEIPSVSMIIRELRVLELRVHVPNLAEKVEVRPISARCGAFGIAVEHLAGPRNGRVLLFGRAHR